MISAFAKSENEHARLAMLQLLQQDSDYKMNDSVLQSGLEMMSFNLSYSKLQTELSWLEEQGAVELESVLDVILINLTRRGEDIALGRSAVPGIARPRPRT